MRLAVKNQILPKMGTKFSREGSKTQKHEELWNEQTTTSE
jgi:hypothetical protein